MPFELAPLPYAMDALEPYLDARTMEIHYGKHHQTYLNNLNLALEKYPQFYQKSIEDILKDLNQIPEDARTAVRNHGGGYYHHAIYWTMLTPGGSQAKGKLATAIETAFGSFTAFKDLFEKAAMSRFGSGWGWLSKKQDGSLIIHSTSNQDSPLSDGLYPILTVDVWEHAYYLKYQNRRAEFITNWWHVVNWDVAEQRYLDGKN